METEILAQVTNISTIVALLGGIILGAVRYINNMAEKKARELKETTEKTHKETREYTDSKFALLKQQIENLDEKVNYLSK